MGKNNRSQNAVFCVVCFSSSFAVLPVALLFKTVIALMSIGDSLLNSLFWQRTGYSQIHGNIWLADNAFRLDITIGLKKIFREQHWILHVTANISPVFHVDRLSSCII